MLSAFIIASTEPETIGVGPDEHGKYQGIIAHSKDHPAHPYMPIISSAFQYDSAQQAKDAMDEQVRLIREAVQKEFGEKKEGQ
jgi:hypothetical protein